MWNTVLVSAAVTAVLTTAIGAGVIRGTSDGGSAAPSASEIAAADTVTTTDSSVEPTFFDAAMNAGPAAPAIVEVNMQADATPAPPPDATPAPPPDPTNPESEDAGWGNMEGMHGAEHFDWMRQHMGEGMMGGDGGGMMGGDGGGMMGGSTGSGTSGSGMMSW